MIEDCIGRGRSVQEGGAVYNFTGPQGFGIANMTDALYAVKKLVFEEKKFSMAELKQALKDNFGKGLWSDTVEEITKDVVNNLIKMGRTVSKEDVEQISRTVIGGTVTDEQKKRYDQILEWIEEVPKYGNDIQ